MPIAKHLIVENGVLKVTEKLMPIMAAFSNVEFYNSALESWKQEALVVQNWEELSSKHYAELPRGACKLHSGIYDAPAGLEYDVVLSACNADCPDLSVRCCHPESCKDIKKFYNAILSFASPKEETPASKEKPDFEAKVNFYREQTAKLREYLEVNRIGRANQNLFEALYDHVNEQREQIAALQEEIRQLKNKQ